MALNLDSHNSKRAHWQSLAINTQTMTCQQSPQGRGQTKTKQERGRTYGCEKRMCFKVRFERGQHGFVTRET